MPTVGMPSTGPPIATTGRSSALSTEQLGAGELDRDGEQGVDAPAQQEVLEDPPPLIGAVPVEVVQGQVEAGGVEVLVDRGQHRAEVPAVDVRHDHPDVAVATRRERVGARRRHVRELERRRTNALLHVRGHAGAPAERARCRRHRDSRAARDVLHPCQCVPFVRWILRAQASVKQAARCMVNKASVCPSFCRGNQRKFVVLRNRLLDSACADGARWSRFTEPTARCSDHRSLNRVEEFALHHS